MKKNLLLFLAFILFAQLYAGQVNLDRATIVAKQHLQSNTNLRSASENSLSLAYVEYNKSALRSASVADTTVYYYVFNIGQENGFIIISGDDVARPILAYSEAGHYNAEDMPANFKAWMDQIRDGIIKAIESKQTASPEIRAEWERYLNGSTPSLRSVQSSSVAPLLSTKWDQISPYNLQCPFYDATHQSVTGCVATTVAQLMKYYNYPSAGKGTTEAYTTTSNNLSIPAITLDSFKWSNMLNSYNASSTTEQKNAVAKLMYHVGAALQMDYGAESGATIYSVPKVLTQYFGYDKSIQVLERVYYSDSSWIAIMKKELNYNKPVYYSGSNTQDGHSFICDGYDSNDMFHFNWGWGGTYDGYYTLNALNPGTSGTGSGSGVFNDINRIVINLMPDIGGVAPLEIKMYSNSALKLSSDSVKKGEVFTFTGSYKNTQLLSNFAGEVGILLLDSLNNPLFLLGSDDIKDLPWGYASTMHINCEIPINSSYSSGKYKVRPAWRLTSNEGWILMDAPSSMSPTLDLYLKSETVPSLRIYKTFTSTKDQVKHYEKFSVTANFLNVIDLPVTANVGYALVDSKDSILAVVGEYPNQITLNSLYYKSCAVLCMVPHTIAYGNYTIKGVVKFPNKDWAVVYPNDNNTPSSLSITVQERISPVLNWQNPASVTVGTPLTSTQLNATANVAGSFRYNPNFGTVLSEGLNQALIVQFIPEDTVGYKIVSDTVLINILNTSDLNSVKTSASTNLIYPNPCSTSFYVKAPEVKQSLELRDLNANLMLRKEIFGSTEIDVHSLPSGVYVVQIDGLVYRLIKE